MKKVFLLFICIFTFISAACQEGSLEQNPTLVPTAELNNGEVGETPSVDPLASETTAPTNPTSTPILPTETPIPLEEMTVCLDQLPETVYLYGNQTDSAQILRQPIYEPLITTLQYGYQAMGLEKLPDLETGGAVLKMVNVRTGDRVVNSSGQPVTLQSGMQIETVDGSLITYDGSSEVEMIQLEAEFTFKPFVWSDGTPLTAVDSVFSFNIAAESVTPVDKELIERTAVYEAIDDLTVRWQGLPGHLDRTYFLNVWTPLPSHQLSRYTAPDLLDAPETNLMPLSYGPFMIINWEADQIVMERNPYYASDFGSEIGRIFFIAEPDGIDGILNGRCHIGLSNSYTLEQIPEILDQEAAGNLQPLFRQSLAFEHIDFGINPERQYAAQRPDWFEESQVRQAFIHCIDRQKLIDDLLFGQGVLMDAYVSADHPHFPADGAVYEYNPDLGNQLLDELGLIDEDGDGVRELIERGERTISTPMTITLGTDDLTPLRHQINSQVKMDLAACGVHIDLLEVPASDWYGNGPFSPLFGRRFDLATFAWLSRIEPPCNLYLSRNITGPEEEGFGGWSNINATGWSNEAFDAACEQALNAFPNTAAYNEGHQEALRIFTQQLPIIPLFSRVEIVLLHPDVINFEIDATQRLGLWNISQIDLK